MDEVCSMCREKLKSFYEYYRFVLQNQAAYHSRSFEDPREDPVVEFEEILIKKEMEDEQELNGLYQQQHKDSSNQERSGEQKHEDDYVVSDDSDLERKVRNIRKQKRKEMGIVNTPKYIKDGIRQQKSIFIGLLFDFKCFQCVIEKEFSTFTDVIFHYKRSHKKQKKWSCCGTEITQPVDLIEHVFEHKESQWRCEPCDLEYSNPVDLWKHKYEAQHFKQDLRCGLQDPVEWRMSTTCDLCDEKFRGIVEIRKHMSDRHVQVDSCLLCGMGFSDKSEAIKHRKTKHLLCK